MGLKLGKLTDDLLDEVYDDIMRKFQTYRALDAVEAATPIVAYPILSEEGGASANRRITEVTTKLYTLIGFTGNDKVQEPIPDEEVRSILESAIGSPLIDIEDLIRGHRG